MPNYIFNGEGRAQGLEIVSFADRARVSIIGVAACIYRHHPG